MKCGKCGHENVEDAVYCARCGSVLSGGEYIGPYELRGELGHGAMARVWRAWDANLGREVAIKEPLFDDGLSEEARDEMARRFVKEAQTAAALSHPNIVTIYAADVYDGRPSIVMELVEGVTLGDLLESGPLDPHSALDALDQLLDAVGFAHEKGVVHRDIKPDNVFVDTAGHVKLSDFGIAHAESNATRATMAGTVLGTPGYMSPEQAQGKAVDSRSDLFSVAVVAYEMLTGRNPFGAGDGSDAVTLLYRIVHEPVPELPEASTAGLPINVRPAIMAALSKDPDERPQTAAAFKAMLHGSHAHAGTDGSDSDLARRANGERRWMPYAIVGCACVLALVVGFFALGGSNAGGGSVPSNAPATSAAVASATSASSSVSSSSESASNGAYYLAAKDGKVAIYENDSATPYRITDVQISDLTADATSEVDSHVSFDTAADAENQVDEYRAAIEAEKEAAEKAAEEAARKAAEEEEQRKAAEEAERREKEQAVKAQEAADKAESDGQKASRMLSSLDGWWHAPFQNNIYAYIDGGTFTIYRPDKTSGVFFRTITTSDFVRCENGLPGHFDGVPGFLIPTERDGDKSFYITDADLADNGRIDAISHVNEDGSGFTDNETFSRSSRPDYAV